MRSRSARAVVESAEDRRTVCCYPAERGWRAAVFDVDSVMIAQGHRARGCNFVRARRRAIIFRKLFIADGVT